MAALVQQVQHFQAKLDLEPKEQAEERKRTHSATCTSGSPEEPDTPCSKRRRLAFTFCLGDFHTVADAMQHFLQIEAVPIGLRGWHGDAKTERTKHNTAFMRFRQGLARQVEVRGLAELEQERCTDRRFLPQGRNSCLQKQASYYYKLCMQKK